MFRRYGEVSDAPAVPHLPDWCNEEVEDGVHNYGESSESHLDDDGNIMNENGHTSVSSHSGNRDAKGLKTSKFMEGVPGVIQVVSQPLLAEVQRLIQNICGWRKRGFPGSQPVSMRLDNMKLLREMQYKVSWKADGTRYMMLIDGKDRIFFADRDNCIFQAENLTFPDRKAPQDHLTKTLLDGVCNQVI